MYVCTNAFEFVWYVCIEFTCTCEGCSYSRQWTLSVLLYLRIMPFIFGFSLNLELGKKPVNAINPPVSNSHKTGFKGVHNLVWLFHVCYEIRAQAPHARIYKDP